MKLATVIDLSTRRKSLGVPTALAAVLIHKAGAEITAVRPGRVEAKLSEGVAMTISVRRVNAYREEARLYAMEELPIPAHVLEEAEKWDREHGGQR